MDRDEDIRAIFDDHYDSVVRVVFLIVQDWGRAEEIGQDAFVQLLRYWRRVSTHEMPEAWVRRVAIRRAVSSVKREQRLARALTRWAPPTVAPEVPDGMLSRDVLEALRRLPARQRAATVLFYLEDRPIEEIAQLMDCQPSTAWVHLHRARQRLAELLGEEVAGDVPR
jgi:RNA polymerase sigma-70 factor (ECF subfamily)